jgi:hypothetical protein
MPVVDESTTDSQINRQRGVRIGSNVYFSDDYGDLHDKIAKDNGVHEFTDEHKPRPIVDDAGFLYIVGGNIVMGGGTTSAFIKPGENVREETNRILISIKRER